MSESDRSGPVLRMVPAATVFFFAKEAAHDHGCSPFVCGGVAGVCEWVAVMPIDTLKTQYTMARPGGSSHLRHCHSYNAD